MCAGVEPGHTAAERFDAQFAGFEVAIIDVSDFKLAAGRWLDRFRNPSDCVVVEIKADYGIVRFGLFWLFDDGDSVALVVQFDDTVALWITYPIAKDGGTFWLGCRALELYRDAVAIEEVVTQDECGRASVDEGFTDDEGLREALGPGLFCIFEFDAEAAAVAEEPAVDGEINRRRDHEDLANARQHECCQRVVDHGLVVDGEQLLANRFCNGMKPCAATTGENDAFQ